MPTTSTAIIVAFATTSLDISWLPDEAGLVIVHNDDLLDDWLVDHPGVVHLRPGRNLGFGAAVDQAVERVETDRIVLVNPDVELTSEHWKALQSGSDDAVITVPLVDAEGRPTSVVSAYPTPASHAVSGLRLGHLAPRGGAVRRLASPVLGRWGRAHAESLNGTSGRWPLSERWVSGAVMSISRARFDAVAGFDHRYFLYYEDVDLCTRLARSFPSMEGVVADVAPGHHAVGASDRDDQRNSPVEGIRLASAITYARSRPGPSWRACSMLLEARDRWRNR